jgi:LmbE family N-acetylglucosaminyl deacetylase
MKLSQPGARLFVPDALDAGPAFDEGTALARTTHLGVGAHPDDLELMSWHGIAACHASPTEWFSGAVVTDGASSPRAGRYADFSDAEMSLTRWSEQERAATIGGYGAVIGLGYQSPRIVAATQGELVDDLMQVLTETSPEVVYTHNPFDAHDTHLSVALHVIAALRRLSPEARPRAVYGCEVWRSLDWLPHPHRIALDVSRSEDLGMELARVHDSQIAGGKRYDLAASGRRRANATYGNPHAVDRATAVEYALDMTPLMDPERDIQQHLVGIVHELSEGVAARIARFTS